MQRVRLVHPSPYCTPYRDYRICTQRQGMWLTETAQRPRWASLNNSLQPGHGPSTLYAAWAQTPLLMILYRSAATGRHANGKHGLSGAERAASLSSKQSPIAAKSVTLIHRSTATGLYSNDVCSATEAQAALSWHAIARRHYRSI